MEQWCVNYEEGVLQLDSWLHPEDRLVLLNANLSLLNHLRRRGIKCLNLCTSMGLWEELSKDSDCIYSKALSDQSNFNGNKFINGGPLISPSELMNLLSLLKTMLRADAEWCFWYENGLYFQEQIDRTTREQRPWPGQNPKIHAWDSEAFSAFCQTAGFISKEFSIEWDSRKEDANYLNYKVINGIDCRIELPVGSARDPFFAKKHFHICTLG